MIKKSNINELLVKDGSVSIHLQNLQKLSVKMFTGSGGLNLEIANKSCQFRAQIRYELSQRSQFHIPFVHSVFSGTDLDGPKIWAIVPNEIKQRT